MLPEFLQNPDPEVYLSDNFVCFDFETTNKDKGSALERDNRLLLATWICGVQFGSNGERVPPDVQSCKGDLPDISRLFAALDAADFVVAQNAKFELQWLARYGYDISRLIVWDTMLGEYVRLGNRQGAKDLDTILRRYGIPRKRGLVSALIKGGICPSEIPERWLVDYGCWDTESTYHAFLSQRRELHALGLLPVLYTRCLATPVLADIEKYGLYPDPDRVRDERGRVLREHADAQRELDRITGGINLGSPKQVSGFLYDTLGFEELKRPDGKPDRTPADGRRTDAEGIHRLNPQTAAQREFKEIYERFRPLDSRLALLDKIQAAVDDKESDGILYIQINQAVTRNHRFSSSGRKHKVQGQNLPRDYKRLFKSRNLGWLVGEGDGRQLEFRAAADLCSDLRAAQDIRDDFDVHRFSASNVFSIDFDAVTKPERQDAKPETFRPLYGSKGNSEPTKRYAKAFAARWPDIAKTQRGWTLDVLKSKKLRIASGLIFYWPDCSMSDYGYIKYTTEIYNYPISSFATADIIPIGLVYAWHRLRRANARTFIVNTIHDSIIGEVHPEETDLYRETLKQAMTYDTLRYLKIVYKKEYSVPLGVEIKIGSHWSEGEEYKFDLDPLTAVNGS